MKWIYLNNTNYIICYGLFSWLPNEQHETSFPVPEVLGLTCIQEGNTPDAVILHEDIIIQPREQKVIQVPSPSMSHNINVSILDLSPYSAVICRFNHADNTPIPIDVRGFQQSLSWELCSRVFMLNESNNEAHISLSVTEVIP